MPYAALAALQLRPDPGAKRFWRNGTAFPVPDVRAENDLRARTTGDALRRFTRQLRHDPARRAQIVRDFWFTPASSTAASTASSRAAGGRGASPALDVAINAAGVPHAVARQRGSAQAVTPASSSFGDDYPGSGGAPTWMQKPAARGTHLHSKLLVGDEGEPPAWCAAEEGGQRPAHSCNCVYDGTYGDLCEKRHEPYCPNQCSGHGRCAEFGGRCDCDAGFFGIDCSMTTVEGKVALHAEHATRRGRARARRPFVYVYEVPDHTSLILQYRAQGGMCTHRVFDERNQTRFAGGYAYTIETALHEWLLRSAHRVVDASQADLFYVPLYTACAILPVYDYVGPGPYGNGYPMRPVTAMRMVVDAVDQIRAAHPYWDRNGGRDHVFLLAHDEGGCWASEAVAKNSIILSHWGRKDATPSSSSRYMADNWSADWRVDTRAPAGKRWHFPGGSRAMIGDHPCYVASKDLVIPVFSPPSQWENTPWLSSSPPPRDNLAYFSGNLAHNEPLKYSRGIRHRLRKSFQHTPGWRLFGNRGGAYSRDLARSEFCIVPPGGDGWSSRVDDAVRHGCIPVIIMDNVDMPFETELRYNTFAVRQLELNRTSSERTAPHQTQMHPPSNRDAHYRIIAQELVRTLWNRGMHYRTEARHPPYGGRCA